MRFHMIQNQKHSVIPWLHVLVGFSVALAECGGVLRVVSKSRWEYDCSVLSKFSSCSGVVMGIASLFCRCWKPKYCGWNFVTCLVLVGGSVNGMESFLMGWCGYFCSLYIGKLGFFRFVIVCGNFTRRCFRPIFNGEGMHSLCSYLCPLCLCFLCSEMVWLVFSWYKNIWCVCKVEDIRNLSISLCILWWCHVRI